MKHILFLATIIFTTLHSYAQTFSDHFSNETLRVDYIFSGNATQQMVALDELSSFEGWAGRRINLDEVPVRGNGEIRIIDPESNKSLYRQTFSSLFQEWLVTEEASRLSKSFEATFLLPMPRKNVEVEITLLDNEGHKQTSMRHTINPNDKLIRQRADLPTTQHKYLLQSGPSEECIDIAIVAEGYTAEEMDLFLKDARTACDEIFRYEPFAKYKNRFNVVAVMTESTDSGVSVPQDNEWRTTAINSNFMTFYSPRYLTTNSVHLIHDHL